MELLKYGPDKVAIDVTLTRIVIQLLRRNQSGLCKCGKSLKDGYQLTHKRYGIDITLYDLELKCGRCHALEHGKRSYTGTLRVT